MLSCSLVYAAAWCTFTETRIHGMGYATLFGITNERRTGRITFLGILHAMVGYCISFLHILQLAYILAGCSLCVFVTKI